MRIRQPRASEPEPRDRRRGKLGSVILRCSKPWHEKADEGASDDPQEPAVLNTMRRSACSRSSSAVSNSSPRPGQTPALPLERRKGPHPDRVRRLGLGRR